MISGKQHLTQSIERVLRNWLDGASARTPQEIVTGIAQAGTQKDFISDVYGDLELHVYLPTLGVGQLRFGDLISKLPGDVFVFDRSHLRALWATGPIPPTLSLDDLDAQARQMFDLYKHHEWMVLEGKHFDAEAPEGADSMLQLPFFRRHLEYMQQQKIQQHQPDPLPDHLLTWTGDDDSLPF